MIRNSTVSDAAGEPGERRLTNREKRLKIAQLRKLYLQLAFPGGRVLRENVEDHRSAVERASLEDALEVELLRRRELVVEHDGVGVNRF